MVRLLGLRLGDVAALAGYPVGYVIWSVMPDARDERRTPASACTG
jgi:hypothetical protein